MFKDRKDAGKRLVPKLADLESSMDAVILGLARGGVVVAREIAEGLVLPMDVLIAKKISAPQNPELALGAIVDSVRVIDHAAVRRYRISKEYLEQEITRRKLEAERQNKKYRVSRSIFDLSGKKVVLVDDGIATGSTMLAAISFAKSRSAEEIIVAVPVAPKAALERIRPLVDRIECLEKAGSNFSAVGEFYEHFAQVADSEVKECLRPYAGAPR